MRECVWVYLFDRIVWLINLYNHDDYSSFTYALSASLFFPFIYPFIFRPTPHLLTCYRHFFFLLRFLKLKCKIMCFCVPCLNLHQFISFSLFTAWCTTAKIKKLMQSASLNGICEYFNGHYSIIAFPFFFRIFALS